jgi:hypothetical protein
MTIRSVKWVGISLTAGGSSDYSAAVFKRKTEE